MSLNVQIYIFDWLEIWTTASDEWNIGWSWLWYYEKLVLTVMFYSDNRYQERQSTFKIIEQKRV